MVFGRSTISLCVDFSLTHTSLYGDMLSTLELGGLSITLLNMTTTHTRRHLVLHPTRIGYDGGDCCSCTCVPGGYFECGASGYSCIDPEAPCVDDDEDITTPVACVPALDSDGFCDDDNNNDLCGMWHACWRLSL